MFYRCGFDWIDTIDTSSPIVHGLLGISYEHGGLTNKQSIKLVDLLHAIPTPDQITIISKNIEYFSSYVKGVK
jgi:hypothetical protein